MKTLYRRIRRWMPAASLWIYLFVIPAAVLHVLFILISPFADWFNQNVSAFFRALFARVTNGIPFSLAETLIMLIPAALIVLIYVALRAAKLSVRRVVRFFLGLLSVVALEYALFVLMFAPGYRAATLDVKLDLDRREVTAEELAETALILVDNMDLLLDDVTFTPAGPSVMPYDYDELSAKLVDAYSVLRTYYPFIQNLDSRVKPVTLSEPWTYTHISGVYTTFTGEANINVNYPDYVIPFTAAHELAHQRGIAREDEANFIAFLVCLVSDDPYIRYSGMMNLYDYVSEALYKASKEYYRYVYRELDDRLVAESQAYGEFFEKYRENVVATVSHTVNDTYLTMQGTQGARSYNLVVDLAVAFLLEDRP